MARVCVDVTFAFLLTGQCFCRQDSAQWVPAAAPECGMEWHVALWRVLLALAGVIGECCSAEMLLFI